MGEVLAARMGTHKIVTQQVLTPLVHCNPAGKGLAGNGLADSGLVPNLVNGHPQ